MYIPHFKVSVRATISDLYSLTASLLLLIINPQIHPLLLASWYCEIPLYQRTVTTYTLIRVHVSTITIIKNLSGNINYNATKNTSGEGDC